MRDILLGVSPKDFDLATDAVPDAVQQYLKEEGVKCIATGKIAKKKLTHSI